jgi:nucleoside-diphosphate-sugar epimerase
VQLRDASIAITGATGFLGSYLVDGLLARGARVIAVVRNPTKAQSLRERGCEIRRADLAETDALTSAFQGADAVISNAAVIAFTKPAETRRANIQGTSNVFEAIARAKVKRAIAVSSTSAYPSSMFRSDERTPLRRGDGTGWLDAYGESKAAGERIAWRIAESNAIALTTFRPCGITAPNDPLLMTALEQLCKLPIAPLPVLTTIGVVHAADVADAIALALEKPAVSAGKAYNLQGVTTSLWQLCAAWKRAGGRAPYLFLPFPLPYGLRFDDRKARRELGWKPRDLEAILGEVIAARREAVLRAG